VKKWLSLATVASALVVMLGASAHAEDKLTTVLNKLYGAGGYKFVQEEVLFRRTNPYADARAKFAGYALTTEFGWYQPIGSTNDSDKTALWTGTTGTASYNPGENFVPGSDGHIMVDNDDAFGLYIKPASVGKYHYSEAALNPEFVLPTSVTGALGTLVAPNEAATRTVIESSTGKSRKRAYVFEVFQELDIVSVSGTTITYTKLGGGTTTDWTKAALKRANLTDVFAVAWEDSGVNNLPGWFDVNDLVVQVNGVSTTRLLPEAGALQFAAFAGLGALALLRRRRSA